MMAGPRERTTRMGFKRHAYNLPGILIVIPFLLAALLPAGALYVLLDTQWGKPLTIVESIKRDGPQVRWDLMAQDAHATIVGYMGVTALPNVVAELLRSGMSPKTPAAMVQHGSTAAQRSVVSTLADLPDAVAKAAASRR